MRDSGTATWLRRRRLEIAGGLFAFVNVAVVAWPGSHETSLALLDAAVFVVLIRHVRRRDAALAEARRAAGHQREFARDAVHQLKTPIAVARGLSELLRDSESSPDRRLDLADMIEQIDRLGRIAERLLLVETAAQPENRVTEAVDVEDLVVSAVRRWSGGVARGWRFAFDADGTIVGDRQQLESALDSVLENAVQATSERDVILVAASVEADAAVIRVADTGKGIPPEVLPRVFDRFVRGDLDKPGTGLGLALTRAIVEAHGGTVSARSECGRGTSVVMTLPGMRPRGADFLTGWRA